MIEKIVFGTKNPAKIEQVQGVLAPLNIEVIGLKGFSSLPEVVEDGKTAEENARKKAIAFAKAIGQTVFSMDNALYFDNLPEDKQPGMNVRRVNGGEAKTDEDMLRIYSSLISSHGGKMKGYWEFGVAIAKPNSKVVSASIRSPRFFTANRDSNVLEGYPLDSLQINPESGKYISEMSEEERAEFWRKTIGEELVRFISKFE